MKRTLFFTSVLATGALLPSMVGVAHSPALIAQQPAANELVNLDNFSGDQRYQKFFQQEVDWSAENCPVDLSEFFEPGVTAECASITAPLDWHNPDAGVIKVSAGKRVVAGQTPDRLLLSNPGGPGGEGLFFGLLSVPVLADTGAQHLHVGVSPRGTGASTPLKCEFPEPIKNGIDADGDSRTFTAAELTATEDSHAAFIESCMAESKGYMKFVNTEQTARDFDLVRHVLGFDTADYYGISYGTWLGSVMTKMFPNSFDRVILDGNVSWGETVLERTFMRQPEAVQKAVDKGFIPWVARHNHKYRLGGHSTAVARQIEQLRVRAANGELVDIMGNQLTPDSIDINMLMAGRAPAASWVHFADNFAKLAHGTDDAVPGDERAAAVTAFKKSMQELLAEPTMEDYAFFSMPTFTAVLCGDTERTPAGAPWQQAYGPLATRYIYGGGLWRASMCKGWSHPPALTADVLQRPVKQVLMIDHEADAATSYVGSYGARMRNKGNIRSLVLDDSFGHGAPHMDQPCMSAVFNSYLKDGVFPSKDQSCQNGPLVSEFDEEFQPILEKHVYEFSTQGSSDGVHPVSRYLNRDLSAPRIDRSWSADANSVGIQSVDSARRSETTKVLDDLAKRNYWVMKHSFSGAVGSR